MLNAHAMRNGWLSASIVLIILMHPLSGCFGNGVEEGEPSELEEHWLPDVEDRENMIYREDDVFSRVSWNGSYSIDSVRSIYVRDPAISLSDGGAGMNGGAEVYMGLWLPEIEGCAMDAVNVLEECQEPIIA